MRILVAADIHGRVGPTKKLCSLFLSYRPDRILLLGDYLYGGTRNGVPPDYDPSTVANLLNRYAAKIIGVKGDCDCRSDQQALHFPMMQDCRVLTIGGFRVDLIHGDLLTSDIVEVQRGDILLFGHTHVPVLKKEDGVIYFNPGSPSFPKAGSPASYGMMESGKLQLCRLDDNEPFASLDLL